MATARFVSIPSTFDAREPATLARYSLGRIESTGALMNVPDDRTNEKARRTRCIDRKSAYQLPEYQQWMHGSRGVGLDRAGSATTSDGMHGPVVRTISASFLILSVASATAMAQPVTFDEAIRFSGEVPSVEGERRALALRRSMDRRIRRISGSTHVNVQPGYRVLQPTETGFDGQIWAAQTWNLAGLPRARRRAAAAERQGLGASLRAEALRTRIEAARAWIELYTSEGLMRAIDDEVAAAGSLERVVARAVAVGVRTASDLAEARSFTAEVALSKLSLEGRLTYARYWLSTAMGRVPSRVLTAAGDPPTPSLPSGDVLWQRLVRGASSLPEAEARVIAISTARARAAEVQASYGTTFGTGVVLQREAPSSMIVQGIALLQFQPFDGQRETAVARAEMVQEEARARTFLLELQRDMATVAHEVEHSRREARVVEESLLPAAEALVEARDRALAAGEGTVMDLLSARRRLAAARARRIEARGRQMWAEVRGFLHLVQLDRPAAERASREEESR